MGGGAPAFVEVDDKQKLTRSFVNNLMPNLDFSLVPLQSSKPPGGTLTLL